VGVAHVTVADWRRKLKPLEDSSSRAATRKGRDGRTINVSNIGRSPTRPALSRRVSLWGLLVGAEPKNVRKRG
jgi:hypothetical protein